MKSLLIAFLSLAVVSNAIDEQAYRPRKEYRYKYETQIISGLSRQSSLRNGYKMTCIARLQFFTKSAVRVQFENIVLYKIEQPVLQMEPDLNMLPNDAIKEWVDPEAKIVISWLERPFSLKYVKGHIPALWLIQREPSWSETTKKGFLSLFEVNLEKRAPIEPEGDHFPWKAENMMNHYTVFEHSPAGDCAMLYTLKNVPGSEDVGQMSVNKVRDYERCLASPVYFQSPFVGLDMSNRLRANPLSRIASVDYTIKGDEKQFIILSAQAQERIVFSPYYNPHEAEEVRTSVNQTLTLLNATTLSQANQIRDVKTLGKTKMHHLGLTFPTTVNDPQDPFLTQKEKKNLIKFHQDTAAVYSQEKIVTHLRMAATNTDFLTSQESLTQMRVIMNMLRSSGLDVIGSVSEILNKSTSDIDDFAFKIFFDALTQVGTPDAGLFIVRTCTIDPKKMDICAKAFSDISQTVKPDTELLHRLIDLFHQINFDPKVPFHRNLMLLIGTYAFSVKEFKTLHLKQAQIAENLLMPLSKDNSRYIRRMVQKKMNELQEKKKNINVKYHAINSRIVKVLTEGITEESMRNLADGSIDNTQAIVCFLKAIGNAGLADIAPILRTFFLEGAAIPQYIKIMAVIAHRRLYHHHQSSEYAKDTLINVFTNTTESNELRNMAFTILMTLRPGVPLLEKLAGMMQYEKDSHVSSYVLSYLQSYANSTFEPVYRKSQAASLALKAAPLYRTGVEHSLYRYAGKYSEELRMGAGVSMASIGSMDKYTGWAFKLDTVLYGLYSKAFEIGVNTEGINRIFKTILGPKGILSQSESILNIMKQQRSQSVKPQDFIKNIISELNIKQRGFENPHGDLYFKVMDNEVAFMDLDDIFKRILSQGIVPFSFNKDSVNGVMNVNYKASTSLMDVKMIMPTAAGFPVSLQTHITSSVRVNGSLSMNLSLKNDKSLEIRTDLQPKLVIGIQASMGLDNFFLKPTMGFYAMSKFNMPIKNSINVSLDGPSLLFSTNVTEMLKMQQPVVSMVIEPVSEYMYIPVNDTTPVVEVSVLPIYSAAGSRPMVESRVFPMNEIGIKVQIEGQGPYVKNQCPFLYPLKGRYMKSVFLKPMADAPDTITAAGRFVDISNLVNHLQLSSHPLSPSLQTVVDELQSKQASVENDNNLLLFVLNASSETIPRFVHVFGFHDQSHIDENSKQTKGLHSVSRLKILRDKIPGIYTEALMLDMILHLQYPEIYSDPKIIYNFDWQKKLLSNLENQIDLRNTKVMNQFLNMTLNGMMQQLDFDSLRKVPAYRTLDGVIPQELIRAGQAIEFSSDWVQWWSRMLPLYEKVQQESRLLLDPAFINRDDIVVEYFKELHELQLSLLGELEKMLGHGAMVYEELPILQWVMLRQADILIGLRQVAVRYRMNGAITRMAEIEERLLEDSHMANELNEKVVEIFDRMNWQRVQQQQHQQRTNPLLQEFITPLEPMFKNQMQQILSLQQAINRGDSISTLPLMDVLDKNQEAINLLDKLLKVSPPKNGEFVSDVMLMTVQNEFMIHLFQSYWAVQDEHKKAEDNQLQRDVEIVCDLTLKKLSYDLSARLSFLYRTLSLDEIVYPSLQKDEHQYWETVRVVKTGLMVDERMFKMKLMQNRTTLANPELASEVINDFIPAIDAYIKMLQTAIVGMETLPKRPTVYLTFSMLESLEHLMLTCENARLSLLPMSYIEKLPWIYLFEQRITQIRSLRSSMSPIFERYNEQSNVPEENEQNQISNGPNHNVTDGITGNLQVSWSSGQEPENLIDIQISATRSVEQIFYLYEQLAPVLRSQGIIQAVNKDLAGEPWEFQAVQDLLNTYNRVHIAAKTNPNVIPKWLRHKLVSLQESLKTAMWQNYNRQDKQQWMSDNQVQAVLEISDFNSKFDVALMTGAESDLFVNLALHPMLRAVSPTNVARPVVRQAVNYVSGGYAPAVCSIYKDKINTFDTVTYQLPKTTCKQLVAMDCSNNTFAITTEPHDQGQVLEIAGSQMITVNATSQDVTVWINQEHVQLDVYVPNVIDEFSITKTSGKRVEIDLVNNLGVFVVVDESYLKVEISQLFRKQMCGLCSNFDSQRSWEFEGPSGHIYQNQVEFASSYIIRDGHCNVNVKQEQNVVTTKSPGWWPFRK